MDAVRALTQLGGIARIGELRAMTTRSEFNRSLVDGRVVRLPRGQVSLPGVDQAPGVAAVVGGTVSHLSAAQHWGWKLKFPPDQPFVTVPRGRRVGQGATPLMLPAHRLVYADLPAADVSAGVTSPVRTVVDCARSLEFDVALAVADSALRSGLVTAAELCAAAAASPRTGRSRALRVANEASGLADNPFESVLRAIALDVPGLHVRPQGWIGRVGRVDLVDARLLIAIEAESLEHHASPEGFRSDVRRYTDFACLGWVVVRFLWEQAMHQQALVHAALADVAAVRSRQLGVTYHGSSRGDVRV